jgi:competence ComEA-like helix-hairpin-helix protein
MHTHQYKFPRCSSFVLVLSAWILFYSFLLWPGQVGFEELAGQLNINTASEEELLMLPFVGENKAQAIIKYRQLNGPFDDIFLLVSTGTLGQKSYEAISPYLTIDGPSNLHYIGKNAQGGRVLSTHRFETLVMTRPGEIKILADKEYFETITSYIDKAQDRIDVGMFLFKATGSSHNRPTKVLNSLIAASRRGVKVRILLDNSDYDEGINETNRKTARMLGKENIEVVFDSPQKTQHAKLLIIDQRYVIVGSHNLTHAALTDNHEFSLLIDSQALAHEAMNYLFSIPQQ